MQTRKLIPQQTKRALLMRQQIVPMHLVPTNRLQQTKPMRTQSQMFYHIGELLERKKRVKMTKKTRNLTSHVRPSTKRTMKTKVWKCSSLTLKPLEPWPLTRISRSAPRALTQSKKARRQQQVLKVRNLRQMQRPKTAQLMLQQQTQRLHRSRPLPFKRFDSE